MFVEDKEHQTPNHARATMRGTFRPQSSDDKASGSLQVVDTGNVDRQWTYRGKPLYRGVMDKKPGDRTGDGLNAVGTVLSHTGARRVLVNLCYRLCDRAARVRVRYGNGNELESAPGLPARATFETLFPSSFALLCR